MVDSHPNPDPAGTGDPKFDPASLLSPQPTGRRLVFFKEGVSAQDAVGILRGQTDRNVVAAGEIGSASKAVRAAAASDSIVVTGRRFPVAAIGGGLQNASALAANMQILAEVEDTRPEFWMFPAVVWSDAGASTWGVQAVGAATSPHNGARIRVAVLDTGIDLGHPDIVGRIVVTECFVANETVDDVQGHGTHVAGTVCGVVSAVSNLPRYGVAPGVELYIAKVLNNKGAGREHDILTAIDWAIEQECHIINMSLGRPVDVHQPFDPAYEKRGREALDNGCLIVAAAGNESDRRYGYIAPVGAPANAPSILAVAAIGADEGIASFSCGGVGVGKIDLAAPGVGVFSSVPRPQLYRKLGGTSMASPHVAGVAALWAQTSGLRGRALWDKLTETAVPVGGLKPRDVGFGLVQAP